MKIAGSILDIKDNKNKIKKLMSSGIDYVHLDVMDGKYVDNYALPYRECVKIKELLTLPIDIHLMVKKPYCQIKKYKKLKPTFISFHIETTKKPLKLIHYLKKHQIKPGLAINPETDIETIIPYLEHIDFVLVMSVNPGLGGQAFIENTRVKIEQLKKLRNQQKLSFLIEVDGGLNDTNSKELGIDIAVVGSYLTKSTDYRLQVKKLEVSL